MLGQSQLSHTLQCPRLTQVGCPSGVRRQLPPLLHLFRLAPAFGKTTMVSTTLPTGTWYKSISIESERRGGCLSPHQKLSSSWLPLTSCTLLGTWLTGSSGQVQPITTLQTGSLQSLVCLSIRFYFVDLTPRNRPISVHQPRLIVTKIPWIGSREHRWIVNAIQEKYYYVHILGKWYPTDFQPLETKKRALRSSGAIEDRLDMTVNQFFNIIEDGLPPSKRQRKPLRRIAEPQLVSEDKRPRGAPLRKNTITTPQHTTPLENVSTPRSDVFTSVTDPHFSGHDKGQASAPAAESPTDSEVNPMSSFTPDRPLSVSHSRNRSTSQSSEQTVVAEDQDPRRSVSLETATTAVASSSLSKKRKAEFLDEVIGEGDQQQNDESIPVGMITRGRSKIARTSGVEVDVKKPSTHLSPVTRRTNLTPKAKSKKPRS